MGKDIQKNTFQTLFHFVRVRAAYQPHVRPAILAPRVIYYFTSPFELHSASKLESWEGVYILCPQLIKPRNNIVKLFFLNISKICLSCFRLQLYAFTYINDLLSVHIWRNISLFDQVLEKMTF